MHVCMYVYKNIVLNINHSFSNFEETLTHFNHTSYLSFYYTVVLYYYYKTFVIFSARDGRVKE